MAKKAKKRSTAQQHREVDQLHFAGASWNVAPFGFAFGARKFLEAARCVTTMELTAEGNWHPVGKYLTCHSIELSLKAFLALRGQRAVEASSHGHSLSILLQEADKLNIGELVALDECERFEIGRASSYYADKVFEYFALVEALSGYPGDPAIAPLLSSAEKLDQALYDQCQQAS